MASWTAMDNLSAGDVVTEADMDAIRGNIEYLKDPNRALTEYDNSADYTTTSATYVNVDATNVTLSVTSNGGPVLVWAMVTIASNSSPSSFGFQITVGGNACATYDGDKVATNAVGQVVLWGYYQPTAGAQTVNLQYKSDGSTTLTVSSNGQNVVLGAIAY